MGGARSSPFTLSTIMSKDIVYAPFLLYPYIYSVAGPVFYLFYISPLLPFEPRGKILMEIYLMAQYFSPLCNAAVTFGSKVASECMCRLSFWIIILFSSVVVLAGFRKQFPGSQAAFWMIFRVIGSCLKARTSFLKRGNEEFSELITVPRRLFVTALQ